VIGRVGTLFGEAGVNIANMTVSRTRRGDKALMVLSPSGTTQVVVQIDEKNLQLLAVGQRARLSADAYPDRRFDGSVAYINPGVDAQRGSVEVKLDVAEPPEYLRQDMTVSVEIAVASRPPAVLVPIDAVHDAETTEPWVLKLVAGRVQRQGVRLGLRGSAVAEVLNGLAPGDDVVASAQFDAAPGTRIRPVATASKP
jgi:HlyD family secretion protein